MLKRSFAFALAAIFITASYGELLVYEPFDYAVVNNPVFGPLTGRTGGLGFSGPWKAEKEESNASLFLIGDSMGKGLVKMLSH